MISHFPLSDMITHTATANGQSPHMLYDHQPLQLNDDDYERVCRIPKKKVYIRVTFLTLFLLMFIHPVNTYVFGACAPFL